MFRFFHAKLACFSQVNSLEHALRGEKERKKERKKEERKKGKREEYPREVDAAESLFIVRWKIKVFSSLVCKTTRTL